MSKRKQYDYMVAITDRNNWIEGAAGEFPQIKRVLRKLVREAAAKAIADTHEYHRHFGNTWEETVPPSPDRIAKELVP